MRTWPSWPRAGLAVLLRVCSAWAEDSRNGPSSAKALDVDLEAHLGQSSPHVQPVSPGRLTAAITGRRCSGPTAVYFGSGRVREEAKAISEFASVAHDLHGMACFKALSCRRWRDECANYNLPKVPAVMIFPREEGATQHVVDRIDHRAISTDVVKLIAAKDRTLALSSETLQHFFSDSWRPIKVILCSSRRSTPMIFQALSGDEDFWPHAHFGFARESDSEILDHFGVKDVPWIAAQCGNRASTRTVYNGQELKFEALHQWLVGLVHGTGAYFTQCLIDAAMVAETDMEEEAMDLQWEAEVPYERLEFGATGCPAGAEISSVQECEAAIVLLGFDVNPKWISTYPGLPSGCSIREQVSATATERMHWNSAQGGQGREDLAPVCKVIQPPSPEPQPQAKPPSPAPQHQAHLAQTTTRTTKAPPLHQVERKIPELSKDTHKEIFGTSGLCLVYLREGPITKDETSMLNRILQRFESQMRERGTKLVLAWMDVRIEQNLGRTFAAAALPSAVVLNPHKRVRFASVTHPLTEEGAAKPVDEEHIVQLLSTMLGGDARFTLIPENGFSAWAERGSVSDTAAAAGRGHEQQHSSSAERQVQNPKRAAKYHKLENGASGCPEGMGITSVNECEQAIKSLGIDPEPKWVATYPLVPAGCSVREAADSQGPDRLHFNSAPNGQGRADLAPVCKLPPSKAEEPLVPTEPTQVQPTLPELAGRSHKALFGTEGYCLVYLRKGRIKLHEVKMLLALEEQLRPELEAHKIKMRWAWMDVHVERKLASAFDAEALPSVVIIRPHGKTSFTAMKHEERDGEPMPADEEGIVLLVNMLMSGDAEFRSLPAQRLAVWADGTLA